MDILLSDISKNLGEFIEISLALAEPLQMLTQNKDGQSISTE